MNDQQDMSVRRPSSTSSLSSSSNGSQRLSTSDSPTSADTVVVKIFSRVLNPDVEYKTLSISKTTTCREVIRMLLAKLRLKHRDPNLFFLTIEVWIHKTGIPLRSVMVLDDKACPAQLQSVYPHQGTKFTLQMRRGGLVKVHYGSLIPGTEYKSILLSPNTSVDELIHLILNSNQCPESPSAFALHEVFPAQNLDRKLHGDEFPLRIQEEWPTHDLVFFQLRRNSNQTDEAPSLPPKRRVFPWTRFIDESGNISFQYTFSKRNHRPDLDSHHLQHNHHHPLDQVSSSGSSDSLSTVKTTSTASSSSSANSSSQSSSSSSRDYENFYI